MEQKASEYTERFRRYLPGLVDDFFSTEWTASAGTTCTCGQDIAVFRCEECFDGNCLCHLCMAQRHSQMPFHRVRRWNGLFFEREAATAEIWLGHGGLPCQISRPSSTLDVVHTAGVFRTTIHPCGCDSAGAGDQRLLPRQLMRHRLFPGSFDQSQIHWAFTFAYLDHWLATSHHAKTAVMDYWAITWFLTTGLPAERVRQSTPN